MICDKCLKEFHHLLELVRDDDENQMLCPNCWGWEDARADMEYERQRENGEFDPDNPDHERDVQEEI